MLNVFNYKIRQKEMYGLGSQGTSECYMPGQCRKDIKTKLGGREGEKVNDRISLPIVACV